MVCRGGGGMGGNVAAGVAEFFVLVAFLGIVAVGFWIGGSLVGHAQVRRARAIAPDRDLGGFGELSVWYGLGWLVIGVVLLPIGAGIVVLALLPGLATLTAGIRARRTAERGPRE